ALLELAVRAGDEVGCDRVEELTLAAPLTLPERGAVQLQVAVGTPDESGRRSVGIYSRAEETPDGWDGSDAPWTQHATGALVGRSEGAETGFDATVWPPAGAESLDVEGCYERFDEIGFMYGPVFQGLRAAWRRDGEIFAEVSLPESAEGDAAAFGLHPALLDASLHASLLAAGSDGEEGGGGLPFSWVGVSLHATGASAVRVRLAPVGKDAMSVAVADTSGRPVASVDSLLVRAVSREQLTGVGGAGRDSLFGLEWTAVTAATEPDVPESVALLGPDAFGLADVLAKAGMSGTGVETHADLASLAAGDSPVPDVVLVPVLGEQSGAAGPAAVPGAVREAVSRVLEQLQGWLAEERFTDSRLVFVTRGAVSVDGGAVGDLAAASVWGLVR
ncbi:polyketide synthase dehydratase domain-containing protein, partial [Streptomyces sp. NPDC056937]|uniref:polyketide synthase dehydratase domain-containing protein n=1 Tax=Streptomyces sp. NPDC056937 TaxID=3345969 RepID=UPI00362B149E